MNGRLRLAGGVAFLGSLLLFTVELIAAKLLLPCFGGSAQVWTTCMVFFQAALLAGYLYAMAATSLLPHRWQVGLHLGLLASAAAFPIHLVPGASGGPVVRLLTSLLLSIGLPFMALASTVPVVQSWIAAQGPAEGEEPYIIYAASNAGALAGLLAYPFLIEPFMTVTVQLRAWQACFAVYGLLHLACLSWSKGARSSKANAVLHSPEGAWRGVPGRRLAWLLLSAGPSAALLAATRFLTDTLAAVPLLWVVPLAVYLATFILAFKRDPFRLTSRSLGVIALLATLPAGAAWAVGAAALSGVCLNVGALLILALICHCSLSASRPAEPGDAPSFYLMVAAGGLAGGVVMGLVLPLVGRNIGWLGLEWLAAGLLCFSSLAARDRAMWSRFKAFKPACLAFIAALAAAGGFASSAGMPGRPASLRNFYGIYRVVEEDGLRKFFHGNTLHGMQSLDPGLRGEPLAYFHRLAPSGEVFRLFGQGFRYTGVVGLGAGALAAYGAPGASMTFYELDPDVEVLARLHFSFLADSRVRTRVVTGDARLALEREEGARYDLLVLDAFSSGAVPAHLLTAEAFGAYLRRLAPGGLILCNISNRFLDMRPLLAALAGDLNLHGAARHAVPPKGLEREFYPCRWAVLSRDQAKVKALTAAGWEDLAVHASPRVAAWTDDAASILPLLRF